MENIIRVTKNNIDKEKLFCVKDIKNEGFKKKKQWYLNQIDKGLKIYILKNEKNKPVAFIEYAPIEESWRPVLGENLMFIHCLYVYKKDHRENGLATKMIQFCEKDAESAGMDGVAVTTSDGAWLADKRVFLKNNYKAVDAKDRFELFVKKFNLDAENPKFADWDQEIQEYKGWNLVYSNQCPWHDKAAEVITDTCKENGFDIKVKILNSPDEAKNSPSGFGTFNLIKDGKLISDHYISKTRFMNILRKELKLI